MSLLEVVHLKKKYGKLFPSFHLQSYAFVQSFQIYSFPPLHMSVIVMMVDSLCSKAHLWNM